MIDEKNKEKWLIKVEKLLKLGGKSTHTFANYKSHIIRFLNNFENIDIKEINEERIVDYLLNNYIDCNKSESTLNVAVCSIKFLYSVCFNKILNKNLLPNCKKEKKVPTIISKENFINIFNEERNIKHKCWLLLAFCSGLRVSEIASIKIENISVSENKLKVLGKGKKERYTILPDITIKLLRQYCIAKNKTKKVGYLFCGISGREHNNPKVITNYFTNLKYEYNLGDNITTHSLRHSFATYFLMNGGEINDLKAMLGHKSLATTGIYIHISQNFKNLKGINYV